MRMRMVAAMAAAGMALGFAPAQAQAAPQGHCVVDLSANGAMSCFGTFTEAVAKVTGGRVTTAPNDPRRALGDPAFVASLNQNAAAAQEYVLSIEYQHINFEGRTLTAVGDHPCTLDLSDVDYWMPRMPSGWGDDISSYRAGMGCWVNHFSDPDFQGSSTGYKSAWSDMRNNCTGGCYQNFNDLTDSLRWS